LDAELKRISAEGSVDARGVVISAELLTRLLDATPHKDGQPTFTAAWFYGASFQGEAEFRRASFQKWAWFERATFEGDAEFYKASFQRAAGFKDASFQGRAGFYEATFKDRAEFEDASFQGGASFYEATFEGDASFYEASFQGEAGFDDASFQGRAGFYKATFKDRAGFEAATFTGVAGFEGATFTGVAGFEGAIFKDRAGFEGATFTGVAGFEGTTFKDRAGFNEATFRRETAFQGATFEAEARFDEATFEAARQFGPVRARRQLVLDAATFKQRARIEAAADTLSARGALFPAGVQLRLRWAQVVLDDADLAAPSILTSAPPFHDVDEQLVSEDLTRQPAPSDHDRARPRLLSLRRADVAGLTIANADLRACRFLGVHNLDRLRIEGEGSFSSTARPTRIDPGPGGSFPWGWTTRQAIAEEQHWHAEQEPTARREGWQESAAAPPEWLDDVEVPTPPQIAGLYRALRKGREDNKDEPGAADFYYGEMEMRRLAKRQQARQKRQERNWGVWAAARTEHGVLWLYWFFSGYALRASRAVLGWVLLVIIGAVVFAGFGFRPPASPQIVPVGVSSLGRAVYEKREVPRPSTWKQFPDAFAFSAESTVSLLRAPDRSLTLPGRWMQMLLRILGPVLFGLFVLSLRGRVRR
jgi:uncharacterized protein YjbI with pentapeptide repeats